MLLKHGICGSLANRADEVNPLLSLAKPGVQELLLALNSKPCPRGTLYNNWPDLTEDIDNLLRLDALREEGDLVYVNFTLFDANDKELVYSVSAKHAQTLSSLICLEKEKLYDALSRYENTTISLEKLAFIVVGCYFLDWEALHFLKSREFMDFAREQPGGNKYTLWAEINIPGSLKAVYWGGHSYTAGNYLLHTFGDHESPRYALPDILYRGHDWKFEGSREYESLLFDKRIELGEEIGRVIEGIGKGGASAYEITESAALPRERVDKILTLLVSLGYSETKADMYYLLVPYFDEGDMKILIDVAGIIGRILHQWSENYITQVEQDLAKLNPLKNGVPFREVFIQVWHYIFGLTNKLLADAGIIHDTYSEASRHKGYLPAVSKGKLLQKVSGAVNLFE